MTVSHLERKRKAKMWRENGGKNKVYDTNRNGWRIVSFFCSFYFSFFFCVLVKCAWILAKKGKVENNKHNMRNVYNSSSFSFHFFLSFLHLCSSLESSWLDLEAYRFAFWQFWLAQRIFAKIFNSINLIVEKVWFKKFIKFYST